MKFLVPVCLILSTTNYAQNVNIPDANFKSVLVNDATINTNMDTEIQVSEAAVCTSIYAMGMAITNMTGIETFTSLQYLMIGHNDITSLDLSMNTALVNLSCDYNELTTLNLSANTLLTDLECTGNNLTSLNISQCTDLVFVFCGSNNLPSLDLSGNPNLYSLYCEDNNLTGIDVSANPLLSFLICHGNNLGSLDVSQNPNLTNLHYYNNDLTTLDVSANTSLLTLGASNNQLTYLNVKNGNNTSIPFGSFSAIDNPGLFCIQVDSVEYSNTNWPQIDSWATFSEDCATLNTASQQELIISVFPNPVDEKLTISAENYSGEKTEITLLDLTGKTVRCYSIVTAGEFSVNLNDLAPGIYTLQLTSENGSLSKKILKR